MRSDIVKVGLAATSLVLAAGLTACGSERGAGAASGSQSGSGCDYNIGFSDPVGSQEVNQVINRAMIEYGKHLGVCVTVADAQLDVNKQLQDINQFVAQKMDAIIVLPLSPSTLDPALRQAREQGIKTVGYSAFVTEEQPSDIAPYDALYDLNAAFQGAHLLAEYLNERVPAGGNVLGVGFSQPVPMLKAMVENFKKGVTAPGGELNWLATVDNETDDISGGQVVVAEAVTRFHDQGIDAVMAYNTSSAFGAAQALRGTASENAVVVGQNGDKLGVEALQGGQIDAMVDLVPWRTGMMLVDLTKEVLEGENHPNLVFGRVELVTKDSLPDRLDWDEAIKQIKSGALTCENAGCTTGDEQLVPY